MPHLDAAAGVPLHPAAREALLAALDDGWAEPSRVYSAGRRARLLLDAARETVAQVLGVRADEVLFTAGGGAAARLGVAGVRAARRRVGGHVVGSAIEHSDLLAAMSAADEANSEVTLVPVDRLGRVDPEEFARSLRPETALACLTGASHEVGTRQPVAAVAQVCAERAVPLLVDGGLQVGHEPVPPGWQLLTAAAHTWGGPAGVGLLVVRSGTRWRPPVPPEAGLSVPAVVAAAAGLAAAAAEAPVLDARLRPLVERIRQAVVRLPDVEVVGNPVDRLAALVTFSCLYVDGEALLSALDRRGFAVSSGSSCTSATLSPSHVLDAMGVLTQGNVRVSLWRDTTEDDVERFLEAVVEVVPELRRLAGAEGL